jgi:uncharacterized protein
MNKFTIEYMLTEDCNLACKYCYIKQKRKYMTEKEVDNFLNSIDFFMKKYGNYQQYTISYFGGEPLLNWDILKYSHEKFKRDNKCAYDIIISNGLELDEEKVEYIKKENIGFSLSFDGIWQKENRPLKNGKDSFQEFLNKKDIIKQVSRNSCKVMVAPQNISTMTENLEFFVEDWGYNTPDFSLVRDNIWDDDDIEKYEKEIKRLREKTEEYLSKGKFVLPGLFSLPLLDLIAGKKYGKRPFGCFAGSSGAGYTPDGKYYPCARFATSNKYLLYDTNTNEFYNDNFNFLFREEIFNPQKYKKCQNCKLNLYCNAGCLYSQLENGKWKKSKVLDNVCRLYFYNYRESLILLNKYENLIKPYLVNFFGGRNK